MPKSEYNLVDEKWILVENKRGVIEKVSLKEALINSHNYLRLCGEISIQNAAVFRLLIAVLQTVFYRNNEDNKVDPLDDEDKAISRWATIWEMKHFPKEPLSSYFEQWHDRFWLFDYKYPFYQAAEINTKATHFDASKLNLEIWESNNKPRLFPTRAGENKNELTFAEAARWLITINSFDDSSNKPKEKSKANNANDKIKPGVGWLGKIGYLQINGNNLFETLMLNLVFLKDGKDVWPNPVPCWELEKPHFRERTEISFPKDIVALLTLQSRRILLIPKGNIVTEFQNSTGDYFENKNAFTEQMTAFRYDNKSKCWLPSLHQPSVQIWREFSSIISSNENNKKPGVLEWIAKLQNENVLENDIMIKCSIASVQYNDGSAAIDIFSDSLSFRLDFINDVNKRWQKYVLDEINRIEKLKRIVVDLDKDIEMAAGCSIPKNVNNVIAQFYSRIDVPLREWIFKINPNCTSNEENELIENWRKKSLAITKTLAKELVDSAGESAFIGRWYKEVKKKAGKKNKDEAKEFYISSPEAYNKFNWRLNDLTKGGLN